MFSSSIPLVRRPLSQLRWVVPFGGSFVVGDELRSVTVIGFLFFQGEDFVGRSENLLTEFWVPDSAFLAGNFWGGLDLP